jgi:leader peptidase (prepilin peptidase)/N-methyltransferase
VTTLQTVLVAVFGVLIMSAIGSFMCVIIDRLPKYLDEPNEYHEHWDTNSWSDVLGGNSRCSSCGAPVRPRDNIPVLSWLLLRGRCRNPECAERIPSFHPLVELAVPAFSAAIVWANGWSWWLLPWLALVPVGIAIAVIDWRTLMVPTRLVWPSFAIVVVLSAVAALAEGDPAALLGGLVGIAVLAGPLFVLWWIQPTGIGFGDVRLTVLLGWTIGSAAMAVGGPWVSSLFIALIAMVVASALGIVAGLATLGRPLPSTLQYLQDQGAKRTPFRKRPVPFGPPLVVSALLALIVVQPFVEPFI